MSWVAKRATLWGAERTADEVGEHLESEESRLHAQALDSRLRETAFGGNQKGRIPQKGRLVRQKNHWWTKRQTDTQKQQLFDCF